MVATKNGQQILDDDFAAMRGEPPVNRGGKFRERFEK